MIIIHIFMWWCFMKIIRTWSLISHKTCEHRKILKQAFRPINGSLRLYPFSIPIRIPIHVLSRGAYYSMYEKVVPICKLQTSKEKSSALVDPNCVYIQIWRISLVEMDFTPYTFSPCLGPSVRYLMKGVLLFNKCIVLPFTNLRPCCKITWNGPLLNPWVISLSF